jgi:hypothetical protein
MPAPKHRSIPLAVALLISVVFGSASALAASWSVFADVVTDDDSTICKFEITIDMYMASEREFENLDDSCSYSIKITGSLALEDIDVLRKLTKVLSANPRVKRPSDIQIDSPGGSIVAAVLIAQEIRTRDSPFYGLGSAVLADGKCYSSCVFIIAGSFRRHIFGEMGIHRPRFVGDEYSLMGYGSLQEAYSGLYGELKKFLSNTNIHPSLIDDMWMVPSSELQVLSEAQMTRYGLNNHDIILEEQRLLNIVAACGEQAPQIEKAFKQQVSSLCADSTGLINGDCYQTVLKRHPWGECDQKLYGW